MKADFVPPCATVATPWSLDFAVHDAVPCSLTVTVFFCAGAVNAREFGDTFKGLMTSTSIWPVPPAVSTQMLPSLPGVTASGLVPACSGGVNVEIVCDDVFTRKTVFRLPLAHHGSPSGPRWQNCSVSFEPKEPPIGNIVIVPAGVMR